MLVDGLLNQGPGPLLEQMLQFTEKRQNLLADDVANVSTPGYRQKDLSVEKFQQMLLDRVDQGQSSASGSVRFDDIHGELDNPRNGILFHDGNNRSIEYLMTENAKNALMHNMVVELLKKQYQTMEMALKERIA